MAIARGPVAGVLALARLREDDVTWRLLRAEHAELIAGLMGARRLRQQRNHPRLTSSA